MNFCVPPRLGSQGRADRRIGWTFGQHAKRGGQRAWGSGAQLANVPHAGPSVQDPIHVLLASEPRVAREQLAGQRNGRSVVHDANRQQPQSIVPAGLFVQHHQLRHRLGERAVHRPAPATGNDQSRQTGAVRRIAPGGGNQRVHKLHGRHEHGNFGGRPFSPTI